MHNDRNLVEENGDGLEPENNKSGRYEPLGKNQKIAVAVLGFFAILIVGLWAVQLKKTVREPLQYSGNNSGLSGESSFYNSENNEENLKAQDTDGDGLSDWDELNTYSTSPYLEDSDSDGFGDKNEIASKNDPNCPTGKTCASININNGEGQNTAGAGSLYTNADLEVLEALTQLGQSSLSGESGQAANKPPADAGAGTAAEGTSEAYNQLASGQADAARLRQMLLDAGMDKAQLDQISDEILLKSYEQVLEQK